MKHFSPVQRPLSLVPYRTVEVVAIVVTAASPAAHAGAVGGYTRHAAAARAPARAGGIGVHTGCGGGKQGTDAWEEESEGHDGNICGACRVSGQVATLLRRLGGQRSERMQGRGLAWVIEVRYVGGAMGGVSGQAAERLTQAGTTGRASGRRESCGNKE